MSRSLTGLCALAATALLLLASTATATAAPPANDNFASATVLSNVGPQTALSGSTAESTGQAGEPDHAGNSLAASCTDATTPNTACLRSVWYSYTPTQTGYIQVTTCSNTTDFDTTLAVYTGTSVSGLTEVVSNDQLAGCPVPGASNSSFVRFFGFAGQTYRIAVAGADGATGTVGGTVSPVQFDDPPGHDAFANAIALPGSGSNFSWTNGGATGESGEPNHAGGSLPAGCSDATTPSATCLDSVWYTWTAPAAGATTIDLCNSNYDTTLAVYTGSAVNALTEVAANDDRLAGAPACARPKTSYVAFQAAAGQTYRIAVAGHADFGNFGGTLVGPSGGTATGPGTGGSTGAPPGDTGTVPPPGPRDLTVPVLGPVTMAASFSAANAGASITVVVGTTVRYRLSEAATTAFAVQAPRAGRRVGTACRVTRPSNRTRPRCTRWVILGVFAHRGVAGANSFRFTGRVAGRKLRPGSYRMASLAVDAAGNRSAVRYRSFRIVPQ